MSGGLVIARAGRQPRSNDDRPLAKPLSATELQLWKRVAEPWQQAQVIHWRRAEELAGERLDRRCAYFEQDEVLLVYDDEAMWQNNYLPIEQRRVYLRPVTHA